ncbi:MAG: class I SAM-dependent methyltransferase [Chloroherpetonaceae bacterium]|nr:class I SAM-dependent methyltransferase [Chloroherpetonaceae bacterium]
MRWTTVIRLAKSYSLHRVGKCTVCGKRSLFLAGNLPDRSQMRESLLCVWCRSSSRKRHVALGLMQHFGLPLTSLAENRGALMQRKLYSASANEPIYRAIGEGNPNYIASEFFPDVPAGKQKGGVLCQNLECLTFPNSAFDAVITEDVLEHVRNWHQAVREIARVLKPAGVHIFTVPLCLDRPTVERV